MPAATVGNISGYMEEWAPLEWAESWDNCGLQAGHPGRPAERVLVALELTDALVDEALAVKADLLVLHHPTIFKPLKALRFDTAHGRRLERLIQASIAIYAAHTNFDQATGGTHDVLAAAAGLTTTDILAKSGEEPLIKLAVFVPRGHADAVRDALAGAGAGHIGNYSHCTFQTPGTGTFLPLAGTNPYIGEQGRLERVDELRLETIVPKGRLGAAIRAMLAAHPYEEVAYDLYPLANPGRERGHGRIGRLAPPVTVAELAGRLKTALGVAQVRLAGDPSRPATTVAVCAGSGSMFIPQAARRGADVYITGDVDHHDAQDALDLGLCVLDVGHHAGERIAMPALAEHLRRRLAADGLATEVRVATADVDPLASI